MTCDVKPVLYAILHDSMNFKCFGLSWVYRVAGLRGRGAVRKNECVNQNARETGAVPANGYFCELAVMKPLFSANGYFCELAVMKPLFSANGYFCELAVTKASTFSANGFK